MAAAAPSSKTKHREVLSAGEIAAFRRDGLIVPEAMLSSKQLSHLQGLIDDMDRLNPGLLDKPVVSPHAPGTAKGDNAAWMAFSTQPLVLDLVEQLMGPDIVMWGAALFYKRAQKAPMTVWHRDADFHPIKPNEALIIWVAAFDSVIENGCLRFIPGSHTAREASRYVSPTDENFTDGMALADEAFDASLARDVEVRAGQMVVFDAHLIHGARPNQGTKPRAGYALRFMPAYAHYDQDWAAREPERFAPSAAQRPLFLVRGVDRCGLNILS
jgi:phytanoyl-CoA dioxygenase PhyH